MKVEILQTTDKGQKVIGTIMLLPDGRVVWSKDFPEKIRRELETLGAKVKNVRYKPTDGKKFMEAMPEFYSGAYLRARLV